MATKYMIWKNPECNGINPEWTFLDGEEFFAIVNSSAWVGRHFVTLPPNGDSELDTIYIESAEEEFMKWRKEKNHSNYLLGFCPEEGVSSLDYPINDGSEEIASVYELIADMNVDVEKEAINSALMSVVYGALSAMSKIHREAIYAKYFWFPNLSDEEIAERIGVERRTFCKRKNISLKNLKISLGIEVPKSKKSQQ